MQTLGKEGVICCSKESSDGVSGNSTLLLWDLCFIDSRSICRHILHKVYDFRPDSQREEFGVVRGRKDQVRREFCYVRSVHPVVFVETQRGAGV